MLFYHIIMIYWIYRHFKASYTVSVYLKEQTADVSAYGVTKRKLTLGAMHSTHIQGQGKQSKMSKTA